ncbi:MAG: hypothetical protein AB7S26_30365 [Sandaracinaceae bacterium]
MTAIWVASGAVASALVIGLFVWLLVASGPELARVKVVPGEPFRVRAHCAGSMTVWCDVAVTYASSLELHGPVRATRDGREVWSGTLWLSPRGSTQQGMARSGGVKKTWFFTPGKARGVTRLAKIELPRSPGEITVEGTIEAGPGTELEKLEIVLAAPLGSRPTSP